MQSTEPQSDTRAIKSHIYYFVTRCSILRILISRNQLGVIPAVLGSHGSTRTSQVRTPSTRDHPGRARPEKNQNSALSGSHCQPPDSLCPGPPWPWLASVGPPPVRHPSGRTRADRPELRRSSGHRKISRTLPDVLNPQIRPPLSISHHFKLFQPKPKGENLWKPKSKGCLPWEMTRGSRIRENIQDRTDGSSGTPSCLAGLSPCSLSRLLLSLFSDFK